MSEHGDGTAASSNGITSGSAGGITGDFTDGNALAGPLAEVFAVDVTVADAQCVGCGTTGTLATLHVYSHAPGYVARCPACEAVVLRLVRSPDAAWLDLRGAVRLRVPMPATG